MARLNRLMFGMAAMATALAGVAQAGVGDLLVAPTRLILTNGRGAEVLLKNTGSGPATYRVSAELRRMRPDGSLEEVTAPNDEEKLAQQMITYAPRKITLLPGQPQSVRIGARAPAGLPDGEYRVHMLFRAIPEAAPVDAAPIPGAVGFALVPVYGLTIPVIIRMGNVTVTAGISDVKLAEEKGRKMVSVVLSRQGNRSTYGEVRVTKDGVKAPIATLRGVALYKEVANRKVLVPVNKSYLAEATGKVKVEYIETGDNGDVVAASTDAVLR